MKHDEIITLHSHGINWVWFTECRIIWPYGRMCLEVLKHWRIHRGDPMPETIGAFTMLENRSRTVCAIEVVWDDNTTATYAVENPAHVFSYN